MSFLKNKNSINKRKETIAGTDRNVVSVKLAKVDCPLINAGIKVK